MREDITLNYTPLSLLSRATHGGYTFCHWKINYIQ